MQKQGLLQIHTELKLRGEAFFLRRVRRVVAVEVEAALADRDDARMRRDAFQFVGVFEVLGVVRMDADSAMQIEALGNLRCFPAFFDGRASDDQRCNTRSAGARDNLAKVLLERGMGKVRADVDHSLPCGSPRPRRIFRPLMTSFTVPASGRLRRARSASCRTMLMSFSAHGMPERSARWSIAQFCALE